ncbi:hypothetical protein [Nocardioides pocheonensis]|uniref:Uncharacterized protein n=1 Tax=Nocardioides pocheonensis TaxID=661485 RepID=A0A3N0GQ11_9ACTN|nr:hypothetical protein [Nocardioides pocheonensis]RNM14190.1 hypothetical protein EFL26_14815 [Nocardioides pocheonensis]
MGTDERSSLRLELAEFLSSHLAGDGSHDLFELASADPQMFFAELLSRHRSGELVLPAHLLKAITRDFERRDPEPG